MSTEAEVRDNVRRGAELLDSKYPEWFRQPFDWSSLNLSNGDKCIIGQLARGDAPWSTYLDGLDFLYAGAAIEHGYVAAEMDDRDYEVSKSFHNRLWRDEVESRLNAAPVQPAALPDNAVILTKTQKALILDLLHKHEREIIEAMDSLDPRFAAMLQPERATTRELLDEFEPPLPF